MSSLETQQLNELDILIKNTEFETSQQNKALAEERQKIETLQLQLHEYYSNIKDAETSALGCEETIRKLNNRLIHHKESCKSLTGTSSVLDDHCEALKNKLQLAAQNTVDQRNVQLDAINKYMTIWNNYESHYHDSIKAKQYLELKTELQTLHTLKDSLDENVQSLTAHVSTNAQIENKRKLISWIVNISSVKTKTIKNVCQIKLLEESCKQYTSSVNEIIQLIQSIKSDILTLKKEKQSKDNMINESRLLNLPKQCYNEPSSTFQRCDVRLELPRATKPSQIHIPTPPTRKVFTMNMPSSISRNNPKTLLMTPKRTTSDTPQKPPPETPPNPMAEDKENSVSYNVPQTISENNANEHLLARGKQQDMMAPQFTIPSIIEKEVHVHEEEVHVHEEASSFIGGDKKDTSSTTNTSMFDCNFSFESNVLQDQTTPFGQGDKSIDNFFAQGDTNWLGQPESDNNVDMFSLFCGGPTDIGNLFGESTDKADHGSDSGGFSLFGSPKGATHQNGGFTIMDSSTENTSFSLFQ